MKYSLCRFDSDGHTHINKDENIPLAEQHVKTPHFHIWDESGKEIAYRTDSIDLHENAIFEDINQGFSLFCNEFSFNGVNEKLPPILTQLRLFPDFTLEDVHAGLKFD
ncbi:hypothetical protein GO730_00225 [Spirosoma sp. HMF3257]|uniref:Uncharacterized protein n=1 Tax=Spirosoma telluris TaxID=2183553 RepID=A0A327ND87_9BACT|nr:hypothetical protein [Spirosoma telluris]RAI73231.1 hypothetical protein HMF3257_00215 [Spirosoma telluris]